MWTKFYDLHSGGGKKLDWEVIYIEASEQEAIEQFEKLFDRDPNNVTCSCCGQDYSVTELDADENPESDIKNGLRVDKDYNSHTIVEKADLI